MTSPGSLGRDGKGKAPHWRLTELEAFGGRPERAAYLTADNQMTRKPNSALNPEIESMAERHRCDASGLLGA
jgi:hypothetical protein